MSLRGWEGRQPVSFSSTPCPLLYPSGHECCLQGTKNRTIPKPKVTDIHLLDTVGTNDYHRWLLRLLLKF